MTTEEPVQFDATTTGPFTTDQWFVLDKGVNPDRVLARDGQSYLAAWDVRRYLNKIFGFGGWSEEVTEVVQLFEDREVPKQTADQKAKDITPAPRWSVGYRASVRLTIYRWVIHQDSPYPERITVATYTEAATGDAQNFPNGKHSDAHDFAIKTAASQALKRCAINLGDQFGLALYGKLGSEKSVGTTVVGYPVNPNAGQVTGELEQGLRPVSDEEVPSVPEAELDWLAAAEGTIGDLDAFDLLYNEARSKKVSRATLMAMRVAAKLGQREEQPDA